MEYLVRFSQSHETFRLAEIQALATVEGLDMELVSYDPDSPYCIVRLRDEAAARTLIRRSILAQTISELWGVGPTLDALHADIRRRSAHLWDLYRTASFKVAIDSYRGRRENDARLALINGFSYLPLDGDIRLTDPDLELTLFEHWADRAVPLALPDPERYYFGRLLGSSARDVLRTYDLKKRRYIATTSMDAELALLTANIALAAPGKLFYDPFVGTGGLPLAAAHWGAAAWGSDIDGRSVRGDEKDPASGRSLRGNFAQYGLLARLGDVFSADLTHTPLRRARLFDGIVCDPPYGVREGLRVLGCRDPERRAWTVEASKKRYKEPDFVPPKQPYSFHAMLDDILAFAADTLVDGGRLSFWMPTANDEDQDIPVPTHPSLAVVVICVQAFNKWSRRLITYQRIPDAQVDQAALAELLTKKLQQQGGKVGLTADELNPFRKMYFSPSPIPG